MTKQNEVQLDNLARDYIAMGVHDEENNEDLYNCVACGATVMPWYMQCETCGRSNPRRFYCKRCEENTGEEDGHTHDTEDHPTFYCTRCMEEYDIDTDANRCYASHLPIPHWHIRVVMDSGYATDPISMFLTRGAAEAFAEDHNEDESSEFPEVYVVQCEDDYMWECKNEHTHEWFEGTEYGDNREYSQQKIWEEETLEIREKWLDEHID